MNKNALIGVGVVGGLLSLWGIVYTAAKAGAKAGAETNVNVTIVNTTDDDIDVATEIKPS